MQQSRWQKIEEIFNRAAELPVAEQQNFVEELCQDDPDLCREILLLLKADSEENLLLDEPIFTLGTQILEAEDLLKNTEFAEYRIKKLLGRGGMGAVYLAEDVRLERPVALKILPSSMAENTDGVQRFRQEARAASAISHPNVAHIYEFGEKDERYFLAMEYVEGKTLRELLKENSVDYFRALEIVRQIADPLSVMHKRGIIHRDIKPENIIVTENGLVKILDFGLAKLNAPINSSDDEKKLVSLETIPGMIIGTTAYMSPEQVRGQPLDARTDLWSLGVLLFEMLAGTRPFTGATSSDIQAAILLKEPPLLDLPTKAAPIVGKLLKKNANERYQTVEELLSDLKNLKNNVGKRGKKIADFGFKTDFPETDLFAQNHRRGFLKFLLPLLIFAAVVFSVTYFSGGFGYFQTSDSSTNPSKNLSNIQIESLAVMPFQTEGVSDEIKLLSEGLAEDLTRNLGSLKTIQVISYASARAMRDEKDLTEIKSRLNIKHLLRGQIEQNDDEISVTVEFVNLDNRATIWREKLNADASDLLKLRNALTQVIANEFQKVSGEKRLILTDYGTRSNEAFRAFLEGKYGKVRSSSEDAKSAAEQFERAVRLDPQYALAYVELAVNYNLLGTWYGIKPDYYQPLAEKTLEKAIAIDNNLAEAHTILAKIKMDFHHDWTATEREFRKAIELNPNYALAHHWYGEVFLSAMGRYDESLRELEIARRLNPLSSGIVTGLAHSYIGKKDYERAVGLCDEAAIINPKDDSVYSYKAMALMKLERYDEAIESAKKSSNGEESTELGVIYALSGRTAEAREVLKKMQKNPDASPYSFAVIYGALGEKDRAFELLNKQLKTNSVDLLSIRLDPMIDNLRDDPRFAEIENKLNLPKLN